MAVIETTPGNVTRLRFGDQPRTYSTLHGDHYQNIRQLLTTRFEKAESYVANRFERFYRYEKLIHMVTKKKAFDWKANAFLPYGLSLSEQSAAIKFLALFFSRPYVTVQPRRGIIGGKGDRGLNDIAKRRQALIDWHLTGDIQFWQFGSQMFRMAERYGKAIAVIAPEWNREAMKYRSPSEYPTAMGPVARMSWKMRQSKEFKYRAMPIDLTDFIPEPGKTRINGPNGMRWCFRRMTHVLDELRSMEAAGLLGEAVGGESVERIRETRAVESNEYKMRRMFLDRGDDMEGYHDEFDQTVEVLEAPVDVPQELVDPERAQMEEMDGLNPLKRLYLMANREVILQDIALPWDHGMKPYIEMDSIADPYDFYGKGKIEPNEHLIYVGNELVNTRLDNVKQLVNALIGVYGQRMPAGWKKRLVSQPYGVIETMGPPSEVIQRLVTGDVTQSSYQEGAQLWALMQEASAINETLSGGSSGPVRTLGEHALKAESASRRLQYELVYAANQLLGFPYGLSGFLIGLDRQYLPIPTYLNLIGPQFPDGMMDIEITADVLATEDEMFSYAPTGVTEGMNVQSKRADMANMLNALNPYVPMLMQGGFDVIALGEMIMKTFGHDPSQFFPMGKDPRAPLMMMLQQQMLEQQAMQAKAASEGGKEGGGQGQGGGGAPASNPLIEALMAGAADGAG